MGTFPLQNTNMILIFLMVYAELNFQTIKTCIRHEVYDGITCQKHATIVDSILRSHFNKAIYNLQRQTQAITAVISQQKKELTILNEMSLLILMKLIDISCVHLNQ